MTAGTLGYETPAEVLREEFILALGLSADDLARELRLPPDDVAGVLNGSRRLTAEMAWALARRFNTSAEFWMRLQALQDREAAKLNQRSDGD